MIQLLSKNDILNSIRMTRFGYAGPIILCEGGTDALFLVPHCKKRNVIPTAVTHGFELLLEVLAQVDAEPIRGVLAIKDADFDRINGRVIDSPNLVLTDTHDIETMMLRSRSFDRVMMELGSSEKINKFTSGGGLPALRHMLFDRARPLGILRLMNGRMGLGMDFRDMNFGAFVDRTLVQIEVDKLIVYLAHRSGMHERTQELRALFSEESKKDYDIAELVCGHDVVELMSIGLRRSCGNLGGAEAKCDRLEYSLRLAFDSQDLHQTELCKGIISWQERNPGFELLDSH